MTIDNSGAVSWGACDGSGKRRGRSLDGLPKIANCACPVCRPRRCGVIMAAAGVDSNFLGAAAIHSLTAKTPAQSAAIPRLREYVDAWPENLSLGSGVMLQGSASRAGKTHLAVSVLRGVLEKFGLDYATGSDVPPVWFSNFVNYAKEWQTFYSIPKSSDFDAPDSRAYQLNKRLLGAAENMKVAKLLVLDDLGAHKPSEFVTNILYDVVNVRLSAHLPTIFTTNLSPGEIALRYDDRTLGRIQEMSADNVFQF